MQTYRIADWMSKPPIVATPRMTLAEAQRLMEERHVRRLPVVQHGQLVGIITWGDLRAAQPSSATTLSVYEWRELLARATIDDCMTRHPVTVAADMPVLDAARLMLQHKIGGLPVVDDGHVVGVITRADFFRTVAERFLAKQEAS